jgi:hypothetical protein
VINVRGYGLPAQPPFIPYLDGDLVQVSPPAGPLFSVAEAKVQARVDPDLTDDDSWLTDKIEQVTAEFEIEAGGRQYMVATYDLPIATWWGSWVGNVPGPQGVLGTSYGSSAGDGSLRLPRPPLLAVLSITYYDGSGNLQTLPASTYVVRTPWRQKGQIDLAPMAVWPSLSPYQRYPITIRFVAGHVVPIVAVDAVGHTLTVAGLSYAAGAAIILSNSGGVLPAPLSRSVTYYVVNPTNGGLTFQVALTPNGAPIAISDVGAGLNFVGKLPPNAKDALLLMIAHAYEERRPGMMDKYQQDAVERMAGRERTGAC